MNNAADGGGGSGAVTNLVVDTATLTSVAAKLGTAGQDLDTAGSARPSGGGTGLAEPLLLAIMARVSETAARISFESTTLAAAVEDCNTTVQTTDSEAAAGFLVRGGGTPP